MKSRGTETFAARAARPWSSLRRLQTALAGGAALAILVAALGPAAAMPLHKAPAKQAKKERPKPLDMPLITVSIADQRLTLYDKGVPVDHAPVSTGMAGHATPMGVFSVLQKEVFHRSNIYSGAPMPFMQRITWSGIAMHAGVLPGYPASHGCIRMPTAFAIKLFGLTERGARVLVTRGEVRPVPFADAHLFTRPQPVAQKAELDTPAAPLVRTAQSQSVVSDAVVDAMPAKAEAKPEMKAADAPKAAAAAEAAKYAPGKPAAASEPATADGQSGEGATGSTVVVTPVPITPAQPIETRSTFTLHGAPTADAAAAPAEVTPAPAPVAPQSPAAAQPAAPAAPVKQATLEFYGPEQPLRPGPITVFVSRKEAKLYIRKGFQPVFNAPVTIAQPELPLGTHVFSAIDAKADGVGFDWTVVTVPGEAKKTETKVTRDRKGHETRKTVEVAVPATTTAAEALARIEIPPYALERISSLMSAGATLIVSDQGVSGETGTDTDIIVTMR